MGGLNPLTANLVHDRKIVSKRYSESPTQFVAPRGGFIFGGSIIPIRSITPAPQMDHIESDVYKARSAVRTNLVPETKKAQGAK